MSAAVSRLLGCSVRGWSVTAGSSVSRAFGVATSSGGAMVALRRASFSAALRRLLRRPCGNLLPQPCVGLVPRLYAELLLLRPGVGHPLQPSSWLDLQLYALCLFLRRTLLRVTAPSFFVAPAAILFLSLASGLFRGFTLSFFCGLASGILFSLLLGSIFSCYALCLFLRRTFLRFTAPGSSSPLRQSSSSALRRASSAALR